MFTRLNICRNSNFIKKFSDFKYFCSSIEKNSILDVPLSKPLPDFPKLIYPKFDETLHDIKITTISNGLKVASLPKFGQFCTVGVIINSGSRYELSFLSGISHFLEKLSFGRTNIYESKDHILKELEQHGGICDCQGSRDSLIYAASIDSRGLEKIVNILGEVVLRPNISDIEMEYTRKIIEFELEDIEMKPDQEIILTELIHSSAFRNNTLGLPKLCPKENINLITKNLIYNYFSLYHIPSRMVLAGVGVDHDKLVEYAEKYFKDEKPIWETDSFLNKHQINELDHSVAQYTGGIIKKNKDLSNVCPGPSQIPELVHFVLGFESPCHRNLDDYIPACVLYMLMGGGGSFSAGGPGKGMYTRLYTNVLNRYYWMYNATAYNYGYNDSGLFCIHASASPNKIKDIISVITFEARKMADKIDKIELKRAKAQLQSMLLMNLESKPFIFEDIARQVLTLGIRKSADFFLNEIEKLTEDDIRRVASKMLKSKVSVAVLGDISQVPNIKDIESELMSKDNFLKKIISY